VPKRVRLSRYVALKKTITLNQPHWTLRINYSHPPKLRRRWFQDRLRESRKILPQTQCYNGEGDSRLFWPRKHIYILTKNLKKDPKWHTNFNLRTRHTLFNCRRVTWIVVSNIQQYWWQCTTPRRWIEGIKHWTPARWRLLLLLQNFLTASKRPHNSVCSCCCSLFLTVIVLRHLHQWVQSSQSTSKPSCSSPKAQAVVPQLLAGHFARECRQDRRALSFR
jgi:hypothetical protein